MNAFKRIFCLALAFCLLLSIAGCQKPVAPDPTDPTAGFVEPTLHTHTYGDWQTDEKNHWKVCACGTKTEPAAHIDENIDEKCDFCAYSMHVELAPTATAAQLQKLVLSKSASAGGAVTAHPGGKITYTISITNRNPEAVSVTVNDTLPAGVVGDIPSWILKRIEPGQTARISYTVETDYTVDQVRNSDKDIIIKNTAATMQTVSSNIPEDIYVLETFNATDRRRMEMAIDSLVTANLNAYNSSKQKLRTVALASMMYTVGFSTGLGMPADADEILTLIFDRAGENASGGSAGTGEENAVKASNLLARVAPTLYGGTDADPKKDSLFRGDRAEKITIADLISGDLIFVRNGDTKLYIVDGTQLVELGETEVCRAIDPGDVLPGLTKSRLFAVLRPSINLNTHYSLDEGEYFNEADKSEYSELEKAIIATAEAYLLRGDRTQYTDDNTGKGIYRWETSVRQPEDYTVDQYGYTNCAAFTYDVHWATYGTGPKASYNGNVLTLNTTKNICDSASDGWNATTLKGTNKSTVFYYVCPTKEVNGTVVSTLTEEEKEAIMQQYFSLLRPGDIICYRYHPSKKSSGHAMLYVGNGLILHSSGSSYSNNNQTDTHEATIRFMSVTELFDQESSASRYMFTHERFAIVRPQNNTTAKISANTASRVTDLQGIIAEKVSSTAMGQTVSPGGKITYTFHLFNTTNEPRQVVIRDELSEFVNYLTVSGEHGGKWVNHENMMYLDITVPANTRTTVFYTVQVNTDVATYTKIDGAKATVNGVVHKCYDTVVANTLSYEDQQKIIAAVDAVKKMDVSGLNAVEIVNLIYKTAFGVENIFGENVTNYSQLFNGDGKDKVGIFNDTSYYSDKAIVCLTDLSTAPAAKMVAPGLFGGQNVYSSNQPGETFFRYLNLANNPLRSRYFWEKDLIVGDIFLMKATSQDSLYIYIGNDTFVSLGQGHDLFSTHSVAVRFGYAPASVWKYLAVLRPSMALDI